MHLYSAFPGTQSALDRGGGGGLINHHLDDATAAILRQNAHHTPAYWCRGYSDEVKQCMGMIRRPWWSEASGQIWPGVNPRVSFHLNDTLGCLMSTESQ